MSRARRVATLYGRSRAARTADLFLPADLASDFAVERFSSVITRVYRGVGSGVYDVTAWEDKHIPAAGDYHFKAIRGNEWRQAVAPTNSEDTAIARTGTWGIKGTDQVTAYGGTYRATTVSGSAMTWRSPAYVKVAVLLFIGTLGGLVKVTLDGDATRATKLSTAQQLVDAGTFPNTILVANGGTLNPTDRVFDCWTSAANDYGRKVLLADDLAAVGHTVRVEYTGYNNPSSTATQKVAISGFAGAGATTKMSDSTAVAAATGLDQDDASVARAGTWLAVTNQATAFSGDYRKTTDYTTPASMTFTTPAACTRLEAYLGTTTATSIARVAIDGDYSRATFLSTVQNLIDAGTLPAACLSGVAAKTPGSGAITSGTAILTTASAWASTDVGRHVSVPGAGAAGGVLYALIASYQSATQVTLNVNASTTVTGKTVTAVAGTLNTTDRVIDTYTSGSSNFGVDFGMTGDLANTTHTLKVELTPYTNPAAVAFLPSLYISGFVAGSSFAVGNPVGAWEADLSPGSVHEYVSSVVISGTGVFVGNAHGYDEDTSWTVAVDGTPVTLSADGQIVTGTTGVVITRNSTLHHPSLGASPLATVVTTYMIGHTGMTVDHAITWAVAGSVTVSYACMYSGYHALMNSGGSPTLTADVSLPGNTQVSLGIANADTRYVFGDKYAALFQALNVPDTVRPAPASTLDGYSFFQDRDDPSSYKVYAARVRTGQSEAFSAGDVWRGKAFYAQTKFADARAVLARA